MDSRRCAELEGAQAGQERRDRLDPRQDAHLQRAGCQAPASGAACSPLCAGRSGEKLLAAAQQRLGKQLGEAPGDAGQDLQKGLVYIIDPRGTGKSEKIFRNDDDSWESNFDQAIGKSAFPIYSATITNNARDLVNVVEAIEADGASLGSRYAIAESSGALAVLRTLLIKENAFDGILLLGLDTGDPIHHDLAVTGRELLEDCQESTYCRKRVGSPLELLSAVKIVSNSALNECTKLFYEKFNPWSRLTGCDTLQMVLSTLLRDFPSLSTERFNTGMLAVPLLHSLNKCSSVDRFKSLLRRLDELIIQNNLNVIQTPAADQSINKFLDRYTKASEYFDVASEPPECKADTCSASIASICPVYNKYKRYRQLFGKHAYNRDQLFYNFYQSPAAGRTRIFAIHGRLDYNSPLVVVEDYLGRIEMGTKSHKHIYTARTLSHVIPIESSCFREVVNEMAFKGKEQKSLECFRELDQRPLDWEFKTVRVDPEEFWPNPQFVVTTTTDGSSSPQSPRASMVGHLIALAILTLFMGL